VGGTSRGFSAGGGSFGGGSPPGLLSPRKMIDEVVSTTSLPAASSLRVSTSTCVPMRFMS
jgi:hypothetical protein